MGTIVGVRHAALGVRDPQRSITFYTEALGMELVTFLEDLQMGFLSFGEHDHDLVVVKVPDDQPVGSFGLAHIAIEIEDGPEQLRELYHVLRERGVEVEMTADHGISKSLYVRDPDGNRLEFYTQVMSHPEGKQYLRAACTGADALRPLDLEAVTS
jgi:catechol 2,3-dioxygenase